MNLNKIVERRLAVINEVKEKANDIEQKNGELSNAIK
jgi:hypothetical protein